MYCQTLAASEERLRRQRRVLMDRRSLLRKRLARIMKHTNSQGGGVVDYSAEEELVI
jgi:hypothetical protein